MRTEHGILIQEAGPVDRAKDMAGLLLDESGRRMRKRDVMTTLYLIRHGDYIETENGFLADKGLSPLGVRQVERLRDRLAATHEIAADVLISSTMPRAMQTAGLLAPALGLPVTPEPNVQEWHNDETEPITPEEFRARLDATPDQDVPFVELVPGAETWAQFMARAAAALQRITREHDSKTIVVICHGGVVQAAFHYFFGLSTLRLPSAFVDAGHASITHWERLPLRRGRMSWSLVSLNDTLHLRDLDTPVRIPWSELASPTAQVPDEQLTPVLIEERGNE